MLGRSTEWMASNSATASFALLDCSGPIRCSAMPGQADINPGHFALASCTRFSPNTRCPASIAGAIATASKVLDTAISVTDARSRRASLQARAISCSAVASPFGKCGVISESFSGAMSSVGHRFTGSFEFYQVQERLLEPYPLACMWGWGPKMSRVSFNRKRAKLKQLLGIRARLAVLALILVAPLMLERVRSLEDARGKQIALASQKFSTLAQHSADAQREVISSVETVLKSTAYIRASVGGISRSCDILRASLPVNLPWIRSLMIVGKDGRVQCSTRNAMVGVDLSDRPALKKARETRDLVFSGFLLAKSNNQPI